MIMTRVVIKDCKDYELNILTEKLNSAVELLGGWDSFVRPGMKVLLKANLLSRKSPESAAVTHCELVRALTRILKAKGCTVWIGDSSGGAIRGDSTTAACMKATGMEKVAAEEGAELKNFDREGAVEVGNDGEAGGESLFLAKPLFDADFIINLPKLKSHLYAKYTGAVKNLFGCIPGLKKAYYHKLYPDPADFGAVVARINQAVRPGLHIMDGILAMDGMGPTTGRIYHAGKLLVSTDPLALDTVVCRMIGLNILDLPFMKSSRERGIGEWRLEQIEVEGDYSAPPVLKGFSVPRRLADRKNFSLIKPIIEFLRARPQIENKLCKKCNMCVESCPVQAIDRDTKAIDYGKCIECLCCHELCMYKAVRLRKKNPVAGLFSRK